MGKGMTESKHNAGDIRLLSAWSIADFSGTKHEKEFAFKGKVSSWAKRDKPKAVPEDLSNLERIVQHRQPFLYSKEAHEYYQTTLETDPVTINDGDTIYSSVNMMLMNGTQREHYHPDFFGGRFSKCSTRIGIVIPAINTEFNELSGLRFKITEIDDPVIVLNENNTVRGDAVASQTVYFPPGHISMMLFRDGAHSFTGSGIVVSMHPLDVNAKNRGNTYDANTLGVSWTTKHSDFESPEEITIKPPSRPANQAYMAINDIFPSI